jgi:hypothetical protein
MLSLHAFRGGWSFGFYFFGIHLVLPGYLIFKSNYIPGIIGILLIIDGSGWIISTLQPLLFPKVNVGFIAITYFEELIRCSGSSLKVQRFRQLIRGLDGFESIPYKSDIYRRSITHVKKENLNYQGDETGNGYCKNPIFESTNYLFYLLTR